METMKKTVALFFSLSCGIVILGGCGADQSAPPPQAMRPPDTTPYKVPVTKEEKIAAVQRAGIPAAQKKAMIDKLNAGG